MKSFAIAILLSTLISIALVFRTFVSCERLKMYLAGSSLGVITVAIEFAIIAFVFLCALLIFVAHRHVVVQGTLKRIALGLAVAMFLYLWIACAFVQWWSHSVTSDLSRYRIMIKDQSTTNVLMDVRSLSGPVVLTGNAGKIEIIVLPFDPERVFRIADELKEKGYEVEVHTP